jgi:hypothetical protein
VVIERALDIALEKIEEQRFAKTARPQRATRPPTTKDAMSRTRKRDHVPNTVLRELSERDELRCTYRSADGFRCTARAFLQVHHESPWARGGAEAADNLRLLCAAHNRLLAEREFGAQYVEQRICERQAESARGDNG